MTFAVHSRMLPDERQIVNVIGNVDLFTSPHLNVAISELIEAGHHNLIINLEQIRYIDSTGLAVLIISLKKARARGGSMTLVCHDPQVIKTFRITGLVKAFRIFDDNDGAIIAFENVA